MKPTEAHQNQEPLQESADLTADLIARGEKSRELGERAKAILELEQSFTATIDSGNYNEALNVLGHLALVFKHPVQRLLWSDPKRAAHLARFRSVVQSGIEISDKYAVSGQPKSVMLLRLGDYYFESGMFGEAVDFYEQASAELGEENPEYHSQTGIARFYNGDSSGEDMVVNAQKMLEQQKIAAVEQGKFDDDDQMRYLIRHAGMFMHLARIAAHKGDLESAGQALESARTESLEAKEKFGAGERLEQLKVLEQNLNMIT